MGRVTIIRRALSRFQLAEVMVDAFALWWANLFTQYFEAIAQTSFYKALLASGVTRGELIMIWWLSAGLMSFATLFGSRTLRRIAMVYSGALWLITGVVLALGDNVSIVTPIAAIITVASFVLAVRLAAPIAPRPGATSDAPEDPLAAARRAEAALREAGEEPNTSAPLEATI